MREIIVDNFAGGGGASTGIEMAIGRSVDIAINHDPMAIAMHRANHPGTKHFCEDVWDIDPREAVDGHPVALVWLSPDCKHFSKAKGGKPVEKKIRGLAWVALRWAATVRPRVIILENVEEFTTWGPLTKDHKPDPKQKGRIFKAFVNALRRQGYQVDWRELRACDYGAPTIRKRLFLIARCDGRPIKWPEPTHGDPKSDAVRSGKLLPWSTAAEIIDWSLPCPSIFERKRPLAENTLRRIARGIMRFVVNNPEPFIVEVNHGKEQFRGQSVDEPMHTITAKHGFGIVAPTLVVNTTGHPGAPADEPLRTATTGNHHYLLSPTLIQTGYGEREGQAPRVPGLDKPLGTVVAGGIKHALVSAVIGRQFGRSTGHPADDPLGTVTAGGGGKSQLVAALLAKHYGGYYAGPGSGVESPVPTVTTKDHNALVEASLIECQVDPEEASDTDIVAGAPHITKFRGGSTGHAVDSPLHTVTSGGGSVRPAGAAHAMGMVTAFLGKYHGPKTPLETRGQVPGEPIKTVDTSNRFQVVTSHLVKFQQKSTGQDEREPLHTVMAGATRFGEVRVTSHLLKLYGSCKDGQPVTEPAPTITAGGDRGGGHIGEVRAFLMKYYGTGAIGQGLDQPVHTVTSKDTFGLVVVHGIPYQIVDIGMRMLGSPELYGAQGFPDDYVFDRDDKGRPFTKATQVAMCGNAVPPVLPQALVKVNLPEMCPAESEWTAPDVPALRKIEQMTLF